jgi:hypothetical protein
VLEARDASAAQRIRDRATLLGVAWTSGTHADGSWTEFVDPDGICLRLVHDAAGQQSLLGVLFRRDGAPEFYTRPRLQLDDAPSLTIDDSALRAGVVRATE